MTGRILAGAIVMAFPVSIVGALLIYGWHTQPRKVFWVGIAGMFAVLIVGLVLAELGSYATAGRWLGMGD